MLDCPYNAIFMHNGLRLLVALVPGVVHSENAAEEN